MFSNLSPKSYPLKPSGYVASKRWQDWGHPEEAHASQDLQLSYQWTRRAQSSGDLDVSMR